MGRYKYHLSLLYWERIIFIFPHLNYTKSQFSGYSAKIYSFPQLVVCHFYSLLVERLSLARSPVRSVRPSVPFRPSVRPSVCSIPFVPFRLFRSVCSVPFVPFRLFRSVCSVPFVPFRLFRSVCSVCSVCPVRSVRSFVRSWSYSVVDWKALLTRLRGGGGVLACCCLGLLLWRWEGV